MATYKANCIYGGYYQKEVNVHVDGRLEWIPNGQCGWVYRDGWYYLISYESVIFGYRDGQVRFTPWSDLYGTASPDYSATTRKHVGAFCKEFCPEYTYHDIKRMYYEQLV